MVKLILGTNGAGKTKKLIETINDAVNQETGSVVCIEPSSDMKYDISYNVRLINAGEYHIDSFDCLRGFLCGLYAGNYDISHVFIDNLAKTVKSKNLADAESFLNELEMFSEANSVKFTVTLNADVEEATEGLKKFL